MFGGVFRGKKVLVTGHTGFKGTWLSLWLLRLGAHVIGVSKGIPTNPSMFEELGLEKTMKHLIADVRNDTQMREIVAENKPDFVFHLAAQAIVSLSYKDPLDTISTNAIGTAVVLEAIRTSKHPCIGIMITSDKCYQNNEWPWGYKETDHLGGKDIYSASKAAAEAVYYAYFQSFLSKMSDCRFASGRAGNVIGGGDWAADRIVADCMRSWSVNKSVEIRSPKATRPWQHVLEPLSGYLALAQRLFEEREGKAIKPVNGESFNFGPRAEQNRSVIELLEEIAKFWKFESGVKPYQIADQIPFNEAGLLKLNCDKALFYLDWNPTLNFAECVSFVGEWYREFYQASARGEVLNKFTLGQISRYEEFAKSRGIAWTAQ